MQSQSFSKIAAFEWASATMGGEPRAERIEAARVSEDFFSTLGSKPELGRIFLSEEQQPGRAVVILSDKVWRSRFASNPHILEQAIRLDGRNFAVVGVMPRQFDFPTGAALWMPLGMSPSDWASRKSGQLHVIARLKADVALSKARADLAAISGRLEQGYPETNKGVNAVPVSVGELINGNLTPLFCYTSSEQWPSSCSSLAATWQTCRRHGRRADGAKSLCATRSGPPAGAWRGNS